MESELQKLIRLFDSDKDEECSDEIIEDLWDLNRDRTFCDDVEEYNKLKTLKEKPKDVEIPKEILEELKKQNTTPQKLPSLDVRGTTRGITAPLAHVAAAAAGGRRKPKKKRS